MSDQPPPPKPKPGSLRDRIAAFEKPSSTTGPAPGPTPRPKPGGLSWKPRAPSPPSSPGFSVDHGVIPERKAGGMSASDAKESIGKGGSLKDRMAALQGRGGFGAPPPVAAKPLLEKPKWKPPPVISPPLEDKDEDQTDARELTKHIPHTAKSPESDSIKSTGEDESAPAVEGDEPAEVDQEEEERQRRAAIAARMARLGGARVGMAPPVFGKKPSVKKVETPKEEAEETKSLEHATPDSVADNAPVKSPLTEDTSEPASTKLDTEPAPDYFITRKKSESSSLHSMDSGSQATRTPGSMPVPAAPRRVAPPRKKVPKAPEAEPIPTASEEAKEIPRATPVLDAEASAAPDVPAVGPEDDQEKLANDIEEETGEGAKGEIEPTPAQAPVKIPADEPMVEGPFTTLESPHIEGIHKKTLIEDSESITPAKDDELSLLRTPPVDIDDVPVNVKLEEEEPVPTDDHSLERKASDDINPPPQPQEAAEHPLENLSEEPEEEDEASRRKRVAERLAKMGGINPFAPAPPQRQPSISSEDPLSVSPTVQGRAGLKKNSVGSLVSPISPEGKETLRKLSIDSTTVAADVPSPRRIPDATVDETVIKASVSAPPVQPFTRNDTIESTEFGGNVSDPASKRKSQDESISGKGPGTPEEAGALNYNLKIREPRDEILEKNPELGSEREGIDDFELQTHSIHSGALEETRDSDYDHEGEDKHDRNELPAPPSAMPNKNTQPKAVPEVVEAASVGPFVTSPPRSHVTQAPEDVEPLSPVVPPLPPPPRIVTQIFDADEETDKPEPVRAVAPRRLPPPPRPLPQSSEEHITGAQPLQRLPPTTALDGVREDDEMAAYRNTSRPTVLSPPMHLPQSRQDGHIKDPGIESTTSHRPSRSIPPPPPPPALIAEEATEPKQVGVLSHPPKRLLPTPGFSPMEGTPLAAPPPAPESPIRKGTNEHISHVSSIPPPPARRSVPLPVQPPTQRTVLSPVSPEQSSPPLLSVSDQEILDEEEGDPIDPAFHVPSRQPSPVNLREAASASQTQEPSAETVEDTDQTRRRTIAQRMARLGGITFGAVPLPRGEDGTSDQPGTPAQAETSEKTDLTEEEEEQARKQRIAAKLAGMGGMRFGMLPPSVGGLLPQQSRTLRDNSGELPHTVSSPPPPPRRTAPPPRPPPPPQPQETDSEHESQTTSDDGVKVEAEESELEEVNYEDAEEPEEAPPPVPTRAGRRTSVPQVEPSLRKTSSTQGGRPPVPSTIPTRRASVQMATPTSRKSSGDSGFSHPRVSSIQTRIPQSEYVMVEDPKTYESDDTALPARPTSRVPPPRGVPPPPAVDPADSVAAQWELPSIPSASLEFGAEGDLSLSTWSEDSTTYKPSSSAPPPPSEKHTARRSSQLPPSRQLSTSNEPKLSSDELMAVWGRVGVQICEVATSLFEKSKKSLVGDGTYHGFVHAALSDVPNALFPSPPSYGYVVYLQAGSSVQKRVSEIMPGDIVAVYDARFKGHKGIQTYHQTVGAGEPLVGIVSEIEPKKSKIRVFQANQHVGQQTVESVSYRLEDLKSGTIEISRVMEA